MAGLNRFCPNPPNTCFANTMANTDPSAPIHQGAQGGSVMAKSQPVSNAEPSPSVGRTGFFMTTRHAASLNIAAATVTTKRLSAGQPN